MIALTGQCVSLDVLVELDLGLILKGLVNLHLVVAKLNGFFGQVLGWQLAHNLAVNSGVLLASKHERLQEDLHALHSTLPSLGMRVPQRLPKFLIEPGPIVTGSCQQISCGAHACNTYYGGMRRKRISGYNSSIVFIIGVPVMTRRCIAIRS